MKRTIKITISTIFNVFMCFVSIYFIWGWISIAEIREYSLSKGYNPEDVISDILRSQTPGIYYKNQNSSEFVLEKPIPLKYPEFKRYSPFISSIKINEHNGQPDINIFEYPLLGIFAYMPRDFLNLLICGFIGYIIGTCLVLSQILRIENLPVKYLVIKPIVSFTASCGIYIILYSGGKILIEGSASISSYSIGMIALVGALWSEKFEVLLKGVLFKN